MAIKITGSGGSFRLRGTGGGMKVTSSGGGGGGGIPVTNGLVVYLDAGNPASYPGSGTTWYDLSGNGQDATFAGSNPPTWNAAGYFDGFNTFDYMTLNNSPYSVIPVGNASRTIIAAVETPSVISGLQHIFHYGSQAGQQSFGLGLGGGYLANHYWFGTTSITDSISSSTFYVFGVKYNDASSPRHAFTIDGVVGNIANDQPMNTGTGFNPNVGARIAAGESWTYGGKIYSIAVYNRDLSDAEMQQVSSYLAA
jgi:hypothetical protein